MAEQIEDTFRWYFLASPFINIKNLATAKRQADELKSRYGPRAQVIIMGKVEGQHGKYAADYLSRVTVLQDSDAMKCSVPSRIFKKGPKPVFYPDFTELREGIVFLQMLAKNLYHRH